MDIHKPKPIHNLRDFLKEVGIIVLGVSIALAAEQAVEYFHWKSQVAQARQVITTELATNLVGAANRLRTHPCTERRLDELALILDAAAKTGSLPPLGDIGMPPRTVWPTGSWESVVASQTATHFPRRLLADLAGAYKTLQRMEYISPPEIENWSTLYTLVGPGRRIDPASEPALRQALSSARTADRLMAGLGVQLVARVVALRLPFDREDQDRLAAAQHQPLNQVNTCSRIGAAFSSYGQGYSTPVASPANIDEAMKSLRDFSGGAR